MLLHQILRGAAVLIVTAVALPGMAANPSQTSAGDISHGRYLTIIGGCNDCHTEGYAASGGKVPQKDWLQGSVVGYRGPWGTTYAANLRTKLAAMSEAEWIAYAQTLKARPPMPWFTLNQWSIDDLRALYRYVRDLGPGGASAPAYLPPDKEPKLPYVHWNLPPPPK
jgi:mono/diheme cytochrome c family protein